VAWPLYGGRGALAAGVFALLTLPRHARQLRALLRAEHGVHPGRAPGRAAGQQKSVNGGDTA
jgi:hypothetical protein